MYGVYNIKMLVDSWRRADLVERKTSISNRNANHI